MFSFAVKQISMKRYLQIAVFIMCSLASKAQQNYFVYVQTDNKQPFYVKMDDKVMSSSPAGYLVISKLASGPHSITVGFPKDEFPQQNFSFTVNNADGGYLLKNFAEKGWGLYNMQTMEVSMSGSTAAPSKTKQADDDAFSTALSTATNTPVVKEEKPVVAEQVKKAETIPVVKDPAAPKVVGSAVTAVTNVSDASGRSIVYIDRSAGANDTVTVFIPADKTVKAKEKVAKETTQVAPKDKRFLDIDLENPNAKNAAAPVTAAEEPKTQAAEVPSGNTKPAKAALNFNSDCKANAGEDDFLKIRKKMAAETSDDAMVDAAKKFFKSRCYSVEQVKNLSALFLNDAGRYKFFDAAYPHIYDTQNFASLQSQLQDQYYINRFKAMLHN